jgi:pimeloyl-ACP methyl ester carboxylesterase
VKQVITKHRLCVAVLHGVQRRGASRHRVGERTVERAGRSGSDRTVSVSVLFEKTEFASELNDYDGRTLERDCAALVEALGGGPAHLVGLSMGGGISQAVALRRPDLVAALTLVATSAVGGVDGGGLPGPTPELRARFSDPPPDPDWNDPRDVVEWLVAGDRAFSGPLFDEARTRATARAVVGRSLDPAAAGNHWLVVEGEDDDEPLDVRRITAPTLVVHGDSDPLFPLPHGEALARAVPQARLLVVPGMGHQVPPPTSWSDVVAALPHPA